MSGLIKVDLPLIIWSLDIEYGYGVKVLDESKDSLSFLAKISGAKDYEAGVTAKISGSKTFPKINTTQFYKKSVRVPLYGNPAASLTAAIKSKNLGSALWHLRFSVNGGNYKSVNYGYSVLNIGKYSALFRSITIDLFYKYIKPLYLENTTSCARKLYRGEISGDSCDDKDLQQAALLSSILSGVPPTQTQLSFLGDNSSDKKYDQKQLYTIVEHFVYSLLLYTELEKTEVTRRLYDEANKQSKDIVIKTLESVNSDNEKPNFSSSISRVLSEEEINKLLAEIRKAKLAIKQYKKNKGDFVGSLSKIIVELKKLSVNDTYFFDLVESHAGKTAGDYMRSHLALFLMGKKYYRDSIDSTIKLNVDYHKVLIESLSDLEKECVKYAGYIQEADKLISNADDISKKIFDDFDRIENDAKSIDDLQATKKPTGSFSKEIVIRDKTSYQSDKDITGIIKNIFYTSGSDLQDGSPEKTAISKYKSARDAFEPLSLDTQYLFRYLAAYNKNLAAIVKLLGGVAADIKFSGVKKSSISRELHFDKATVSVISNSSLKDSISKDNIGRIVMNIVFSQSLMALSSVNDAFNKSTLNGILNNLSKSVTISKKIKKQSNMIVDQIADIRGLGAYKIDTSMPFSPLSNDGGNRSVQQKKAELKHVFNNENGERLIQLSLKIKDALKKINQRVRKNDSDVKYLSESSFELILNAVDRVNIGNTTLADYYLRLANAVKDEIYEYSVTDGDDEIELSSDNVNIVVNKTLASKQQFDYELKKIKSSGKKIISILNTYSMFADIFYDIGNSLLGGSYSVKRISKEVYSIYKYIKANSILSLLSGNIVNINQFSELENIYKKINELNDYAVKNNINPSKFDLTALPDEKKSSLKDVIKLIKRTNLLSIKIDKRKNSGKALFYLVQKIDANKKITANRISGSRAYISEIVKNATNDASYRRMVDALIDVSYVSRYSSVFGVFFDDNKSSEKLYSIISDIEEFLSGEDKKIDLLYLKRYFSGLYNLFYREQSTIKLILNVEKAIASTSLNFIKIINIMNKSGKLESSNEIVPQIVDYDVAFKYWLSDYEEETRRYMDETIDYYKNAAGLCEKIKSMVESVEFGESSKTREIINAINGILLVFSKMAKHNALEDTYDAGMMIDVIMQFKKLISAVNIEGISYDKDINSEFDNDDIMSNFVYGIYSGEIDRKLTKMVNEGVDKLQVEYSETVLDKYANAFSSLRDKKWS